MSNIDWQHSDLNFWFFPTKFGALPILQECPISYQSQLIKENLLLSLSLFSGIDTQNLKNFLYIYLSKKNSSRSKHALFFTSLFHMARNHNLQKNLANWWSIQINKVQLDQLVLSRALSLSQHFWEETFWDGGRKFRFPGGGLEKPDGVFWECRSVLLCKVCMFLSLDWKVDPYPGFSN